MVRIKNLNAAIGRKKRIEGIVKSLSDKAVKTEGNNAECVSVSGASIEETDSIAYSITNTTNPVETDSYELPVGMQFFGIIASKHLIPAQKFGPFRGNITQTVEPSVLNFSFISQIPDVEGNDYCLNLHKTSIDSSKWLNSLERCTNHMGYNIVAFNTPAGICLQTVCDVLPGQQLCVAYDMSYDLPQVLQTPAQAIRTTNVLSPAEKKSEPFVNLRTTVGPEFLAKINEQRTAVGNLELTDHFESHVSSNGSGTELPDDAKPTYSVMTADVSETYYPLIDDSKKSSNDEFTRVTSLDTNDKSKKQTFGKMYKCASCRNSFHTIEARQKHMDTAHTEECPICKKVYTTSYLKEHMTFHTESSRVTCRICFKVFSSLSNLRKHEKKHGTRAFPLQEKKHAFKCSECQETFHTQKYLEVHRKKHVRVVPIKCDDCGEEFAQKNLLRRHQAVVHKGIRPFSCSYCQKTFTQRGNLVRHCRQAHADKNARDVVLMKKKFLCRRRGCNQAKFSSRELYIQHLQQHSGNNRIYSCNDCTCVFSSAGNLSKHRKTIHHGSSSSGEGKPSVPQPLSPPLDAPLQATPAVTDTKYQCARCHRSFQNHFQLNRHMRVHKEEKRDNTCNECGKLFMTRSGLSKHIKYLRCVVKQDTNSSNDDPRSNTLTANVAPKDVRSARQIRASRNAIRESKVESPFRCTTCGKDFTSAWYLKVHRRTHKSYHVPCELCGKKFSHVTNLAKHMKYIHKEASTALVRKAKEKPAEKGKEKSKPKEKAKPKVDVVKSALNCEMCDKTLANVNSLAVHRQIHNGWKPFKCEFCDTRFTQKSNMKRHLGTCKSAKEHEKRTKAEKAATGAATPRLSGGSEHSGRARNNSGVSGEPPSSPVF